MGKGSRAVEVFVVIFLGLGAAFVSVAIYRDTIDQYSSGWYLAAGLAFVAAVFLAVAYFGIHPAIVALDARRTSKLESARSARSPSAVAGGLQITKATYGATEGNMDVTEHVASLVSDGQLRVPVTNAEFGTDPAPMVPKILIVEYRHHGKAESVTFHENSIGLLPEATEVGPDDPT